MQLFCFIVLLSKNTVISSNLWSVDFELNQWFSNWVKIHWVGCKPVSGGSCSTIENAEVQTQGTVKLGRVGSQWDKNVVLCLEEVGKLDPKKGVGVSWLQRDPNLNSDLNSEMECFSSELWKTAQVCFVMEYLTNCGLGLKPNAAILTTLS